MHITGNYNLVELQQIPNKDPILRVISDQSTKKVFFEPFGESRRTVSITYEGNDSRILYSHNHSKFIFSFHLNTEYAGVIGLDRPLVENAHLLKDIELYHLKSPEKLREYHLNRIKGIQTYSSREITEHTLLKYSSLLRALTKPKL